MAYLQRRLVVIYWLFTSFARTRCGQVETIRKAVWVKPPGDAVDYSLAVLAGTSVELTWNGYNASLFSSISFFDDTEVANLWVVASDDSSQNPFSQLIQRNITLTYPGTFNWDVLLPTQQLDRTTGYRLIFKPESNVYLVDDAEISSPGIQVLKPAMLPDENLTLKPSSSSAVSIKPTTAPNLPSSINRSSLSTSIASRLLTTSSGPPISITTSSISGATTSGTFISTTISNFSSPATSTTRTDTPSSTTIAPTKPTTNMTVTIGAAIGGGIGGALIIVLLTLLIRRHKRTQHSKPETPTGRTYSDLSPTTPSTARTFNRTSSPGGRSTAQGTYYSPDDILIYPPPEMMAMKSMDAEVRTPVAELAVERDTVPELWGRREEWEVAELSASREALR